MKRLLLLGLAIAALGLDATAQNNQVIFGYGDFAQTIQTNRKIFLYPLYLPSVNSAGITTVDRKTYLTDTNGLAMVTGMLPGLYRGEFQGIWMTTTNWLTIPTNSGVIYASNCIAPAYILAGSTVPAYSMIQSDARFATIGTGGGAIIGGQANSISPGMLQSQAVDLTNLSAATAFAIVGIADSQVLAIIGGSNNYRGTFSGIHTGNGSQLTGLPAGGTTNIASSTNAGLMDTNLFNFTQNQNYTPDNVCRWKLGWLACYGTPLSEATYRSYADTLSDPTNAYYPLLQAGTFFWQFDEGWQSTTRDGNGDIQADTTYFPSGMAAMIRYLHARRIGVMLYTEGQVTTVNNHMGSGGNAVRDALTFLKWRVDLVKNDCLNQNIGEAYLMGQVLRTNNWPVHLSTSIDLTWTPLTFRSMNSVRANGVFGDIGNQLPLLNGMVDYYITNLAVADKNHTFDFGGTLGGQWETTRNMLALCAVFHSMGASADLFSNLGNPWYNFAFTNSDYSTIMADPIAEVPRCVASNAVIRVFATRLNNGGAAAAVQNRDTVNTTAYTVTPAMLGLMGSSFEVVDVFANTNCFITGGYTVSLSKTNAVLLKFNPCNQPAFRAAITQVTPLTNGIAVTPVWDTVFSGTNLAWREGNYLITCSALVTGGTSAAHDSVEVYLTSPEAGGLAEANIRVHTLDKNTTDGGAFAGISQLVWLKRGQHALVTFVQRSTDSCALYAGAASGGGYRPSMTMTYMGP